MKSIKLISLLILIAIPLSLALPNARPALAGFELIPGSHFYFLDKWGESFQSFLTFKPNLKAQLQISFAEERITELEIIINKQGLEAKELQTALSLLQSNLSKAIDIVDGQKIKGKDISLLAGDLIAEIEILQSSLSLNFTQREQYLEEKRNNLKDRLLDAFRAKDETREIELAQESNALKTQKELFESKEKDIQKMINAEKEKLEEKLGMRYVAGKAIWIARKEKQRILNEYNKKKVDVSDDDFSEFDAFFSRAQKSLADNNFLDARSFAKQTQYSVEKLEENLKNTEMDKKREAEKSIKDAEVWKQTVLDRAKKEGIETPSISALQKFDSVLTEAETIFILEDYVGAKTLADQGIKNVEKDVFWNTFSYKKFAFEFKYPRLWKLARNIESQNFGYDFLTLTLSKTNDLDRKFIDIQLSNRNLDRLPIVDLLKSFGSPRKYKTYGTIGGAEMVISSVSFTPEMVPNNIPYSATINFTKGIYFLNVETNDLENNEFNEILATFTVSE